MDKAEIIRLLEQYGRGELKLDETAEMLSMGGLEEMGFASMTSPRELFMQDMEQEPALKLLVELFHAEHITTTKRTTS